MPRIARALADNAYYHLINRGNGRQQVFHKDGDYRAFIDLMQTAREKFAVRLLAWCLQPNHFHLLVQPEHAEQLNKMMQWLMTSHVRRYHQLYGTNGHIWQGRFKSFIVQQDHHLLTLLRYVENNPVRCGLVGSAMDWSWSSHGERVGKTSQDITYSPPIELPKDWGNLVDAPLTGSELESLRLSVNRQSPYGELHWQSKVCEDFGLESTLRPRGRPKNSF